MSWIRALEGSTGWKITCPKAAIRRLLAHVYQRQGSINSAARQIADRGGEDASAPEFCSIVFQDELGRAKTLRLMGRIYTHQARYAEAEQYFGDALALAESSNYSLGIVCDIE